MLSYVEVFPWSTGSQVCELIGMDKAAVSRSFATLEQRGLLKSRPVGLRKVEYATTPDGKKIFNKILKISLARQEALLSGFSDDERVMLIKFLHRLLDNLPLAEAVSN